MKISVITINYNDVKGLKKTFKSVFGQSFKDFEYIVIDGGSTDGGRELIEENSNQIQYWVSEKDKGVYFAMNKGLERAEGDYVLFLNSGDYFANSSVLKEVVENGLDTDIIFGNVMLEESGKLNLKKYSKAIDCAFLFESAICHQVMFIKKELFDRFGNYREDLRIVADWEHYFRLLVNEEIQFKHIPLTISVYNMEGLSNDEEQKQLLISEREKVKTELFSKSIRELLVSHNELQKKLQGLMSSKTVQLGLKLGKIFKKIGT